MLKSPESWFCAEEYSVRVIYRHTAREKAVAPYSNLKTFESVKYMHRISIFRTIYQFLLCVNFFQKLKMELVSLTIWMKHFEIYPASLQLNLKTIRRILFCLPSVAIFETRNVLKPVSHDVLMLTRRSWVIGDTCSGKW